MGGFAAIGGGGRAAPASPGGGGGAGIVGTAPPAGWPPVITFTIVRLFDLPLTLPPRAYSLLGDGVGPLISIGGRSLMRPYPNGLRSLPEILVAGSEIDFDMKPELSRLPPSAFLTLPPFFLPGRSIRCLATPPSGFTSRS